MRRTPTRPAATTVVALALALATLTGCGGLNNDAPTTSTPKTSTAASASARDSAVARCAGSECRVRVRCKGRVSVRYGAPPVRIRTSKTALRTSILADFAGSRDDVVIRC